MVAYPFSITDSVEYNQHCLSPALNPTAYLLAEHPKVPTTASSPCQLCWVCRTEKTILGIIKEKMNTAMKASKKMLPARLLERLATRSRPKTAEKVIGAMPTAGMASLPIMLYVRRSAKAGIHVHIVMRRRTRSSGEIALLVAIVICLYLTDFSNAMNSDGVMTTFFDNLKMLLMFRRMW